MVNRLWANNQPRACFTNLQIRVLPLLNKDQATKKASHSHCSDGPQIHHHPRNQRTQNRGIARLASEKRTSLLSIQSRTTSMWIYSSRYLSNKRVKNSNRGNRETCQVQSREVRCTLSSRRLLNRGMSRLKNLLRPWHLLYLPLGPVQPLQVAQCQRLRVLVLVQKEQVLPAFETKHVSGIQVQAIPETKPNSPSHPPKRAVTDIRTPGHALFRWTMRSPRRRGCRSLIWWLLLLGMGIVSGVGSMVEGGG